MKRIVAGNGGARRGGWGAVAATLGLMICLAAAWLGAQCPTGFSDHRGTEFRLVLPAMWYETVGGKTAELVLLADTDTEVTIEAPGCAGWTPPIPTSVDIGPLNPGQVTFCAWSMVETSEVIEPAKYYRLTAPDPFIAILIYPKYRDHSEDAYVALPYHRDVFVPWDALGAEYRAIGEYGHEPHGIYPAVFSRWAVVALEDIPELRYQGCDGSARVASGPLNAGDVFQLMCPDYAQDTTGLLVESDGKRFMLVGGSQGSRTPDFTKCCTDGLMDTIPALGWYEHAAPLRFWTAPLKEGPLPPQTRDLVRLVNLEENQAVTVRIRVSNFPVLGYVEDPIPPEGPPTSPSRCTASCTFVPPPVDTYDCFVTLPARTASEPNYWCDLYMLEAAMYDSPTGGVFAVAQYALGWDLKQIGDPFEMLMVPEGEWACSYRFWVPWGYNEPPLGAPFVDKGWMTVIANDDHFIRMALDGSLGWHDSHPYIPAPSPDPDVRYGYGVVELGPGQHTLEAINPITGERLYFPAAVYVHGYRYAGSYGYPAGMMTR